MFDFRFRKEIIDSMDSQNRNVNVSDELHEECGVFGMYDFDGNDVASSIYYGLFALQHRGQESCGIAVSDTYGPNKVVSRKGMGLVNEVFTAEMLEDLHGNIGVGHVRYSTAGASTVENTQPLVLNYVKGTLALAHNGNIVNAVELKRELAYMVVHSFYHLLGYDHIKEEDKKKMRQKEENILQKLNINR